MKNSSTYDAIEREDVLRLQSPVRLLLFVAITIFSTNIALTALLSKLPNIHLAIDAFLHTVILVCFLSAGLYYFYHRSNLNPLQCKPSETSLNNEFNEVSFSVQEPILLSPKRLLPLMIVSIFLVETAIMFGLKLVPQIPSSAEALLDSCLLLILLCPTFFFLHYQPLKRHHRERGEMMKQLLASDERFQLALRAVNDSLWDYNPVTKKIHVSPQLEQILGFSPGEVGSDIDDWKALLHPEEKEQFLKMKNDHLNGVTNQIMVEHRFSTKDGSWLWFLTRGQIVARDADNCPLRLVGTHTNITQRKHAEAVLQQREEEIRMLSHKLIHTSEDEKKHLAQDLHDEFGQVLTAFQIGIEMLSDQSCGGTDTHEQQCNRLLQMVQRLNIHLKGICDQLRPVMLDDLGLEETLRWHIHEFAGFNKSLDVDFQVFGTTLLSREGALVLYRICQEALNNVSKHAAATHVHVKLEMLEDQVVLSIDDDGRGVKPTSLNSLNREPWGLGLLGMRERATAVGGQLFVESGSGRGTKICAVLPAICLLEKYNANKSNNS